MKMDLEHSEITCQPLPQSQKLTWLLKNITRMGNVNYYISHKCHKIDHFKYYCIFHVLNILIKYVFYLLVNPDTPTIMEDLDLELLILIDLLKKIPSASIEGANELHILVVYLLEILKSSMT